MVIDCPDPQPLAVFYEQEDGRDFRVYAIRPVTPFCLVFDV